MQRGLRNGHSLLRREAVPATHGQTGGFDRGLQEVLQILDKECWGEAEGRFLRGQ